MAGSVMQVRQDSLLARTQGQGRTLPLLGGTGLGASALGLEGSGHCPVREEHGHPCQEANSAVAVLAGL